MDPGIFLDIRDTVLLPNAAGRVVNDFYYTYTLYPAYAFKSLDQRLMTACRLEDSTPDEEAAALRRALIRHDWLPVEDERAEAAISSRDGLFTFAWKGKELVRMAPDVFFASPKNALERVSSLADTNRFFRRFTYWCLLFAFPLLLYTAAAGVFQAGARMLGSSSGMVPAGLCFLAGLGLFVIVTAGTGGCRGPEDVARAAGSDRWQDRVSALRTAVSHKMDIAGLRSYARMKSSPVVTERYWTARALGESHDPETFTDLLMMLDDAHPNVVNMAFDSLGRRGRREVVPLIADRIRSSEHWYSQWYGYRALRRLGWKQAGSASVG